MIFPVRRFLRHFKLILIICPKVFCLVVICISNSIAAFSFMSKTLFIILSHILVSWYDIHFCTWVHFCFINENLNHIYYIFSQNPCTIIGISGQCFTPWCLDELLVPFKLHPQSRGTVPTQTNSRILRRASQVFPLWYGGNKVSSFFWLWF